LARQKLVQKLKEKVEEKKRGRSRAFRGFKAKLRAEAEGLAIETEVRYAKIDSRVVDDALQVEARSRSLGVKVERKLLGEYHYGYVTEEGEEVPKGDVYYVQILGDKEVPVEKFKRTKEINVIKYIERAKLDNFLVEILSLASMTIVPQSLYEMWTENIPALWKLSEWLNKTDKVAVAKYTFGNSWKDYFALIYPVIREGKFVLVMALTRMNLEYKHMMPITNGTVEPVHEQPSKTVKSVLKVEL